jgi:xylose isomerase
MLLGSVVQANAQAVTVQQFRALSEVISGNYEQTYPLVRCAALFQSSIEWAGTDRFGQKTFDRFEGSIKNLLAIATVVRSQTNGTEIDRSLEITLLDTRTISDLYIERYRASYASTGQAWGADEMWQGDLEICNKIAADLQ